MPFLSFSYSMKWYHFLRIMSRNAIRLVALKGKIRYTENEYDKGENEYINCPMNEEQFNVFYDELMKAEVVKPKDFEEKFFEGCMPFEEMARRGKQTLLFGPMKPVGLTKPDGTKPYAVVQ